MTGTEGEISAERTKEERRRREGNRVKERGKEIERKRVREGGKGERERVRYGEGKSRTLSVFTVFFFLFIPISKSFCRSPISRVRYGKSRTVHDLNGLPGPRYRTIINIENALTRARACWLASKFIDMYPRRGEKGKSARIYYLFAVLFRTPSHTFSQLPALVYGPFSAGKRALSSNKQNKNNIRDSAAKIVVN